MVPIGYCVRCRQRRPMNNATTIINKRGVPMLQAICPEESCGRKVNTFISKKMAPDGPPAAPQGPTPPPDNGPAVKRKKSSVSKKRPRTDKKGDDRRALQVPDDDSQDGP